jgi:hypothetical protein
VLVMAVVVVMPLLLRMLLLLPAAQHLARTGKGCRHRVAPTSRPNLNLSTSSGPSPSPLEGVKLALNP